MMTVVISKEQWMKDAGVSEKQFEALMKNGDLPPFSYGFLGSRFKGWHVAVLERHALIRLHQNIGDSSQVGIENVSVVSLRDRHRTVTKQCTNLDDRNARKQQLRRKKVPKSMGAGVYANTVTRS